VSRHHEHSERSFNAIESEINAERAAALGRAGRRVEAAFARCQALLSDLGDEVDDHDHDLLTGYRAARAEFDQAMYAYLVQREAIGMPDHRAIRQAFPRPPRR
jgi:uncharacterized protein DUF6665